LVAVFSAAVIDTGPVPVPDGALLTVNQLALLVAFHVHPELDAVTVVETVPPVSPTVSAPGEIE
jgi:hypothetical protein